MSDETIKDNRLDWGKEIVAAFLSVLVASITIWMLYNTYKSGSESFFDKDEKVMQARKDAYEREKDTLLYGLSLLGAVLGYYLGRIPAEKSASYARKDARRTRGELTESKSRLTKLEQGAERLIKSSGALVKKKSAVTLGGEVDSQETNEEKEAVASDISDLTQILQG